MPRSIEISAPPEKVDAILKRLDGIEGVVGLARQRGASLTPPGDVLSIHATNDAVHPVHEVLSDLQAAEPGSVKTSEPLSLIASKQQSVIDRESNQTTWDEMAFLLRRDTNPSSNYLVAMTLAGAIAAGGLWQDKLHLVVGAMLVAPAFEPLVRVPFGFISGSRQLIPSGLGSVAVGYLLMALGGLLTALVLGIWEPKPAVVLGQQEWVQFWSTVTLGGVLVSVFGAIAGAVVISGHRSVLTTGVMVTLALIPSMAIVGMGVAVGDLSLSGRGFIRWAIDALLVMVMSGLVFALKKRFGRQRRRALS